MDPILLIFNIVLGVTMMLGGWTLNTMWSRIGQIEKAASVANTAAHKRISEVQVQVAGGYPTRQEIATMLAEIRDQLHRIMDKLDDKADKA